MDRAQVREWLAAYERAWRSPGTEGLVEVFAPDATYRQGPYHGSVVGLPAIGQMWEETRDGPDEAFTMASEVVAIDGDVAVVRVEVRYGDPTNEEYRDLWIMRFAGDGRCIDYEEWPFWPSQPITTSGS